MALSAQGTQNSEPNACHQESKQCSWLHCVHSMQSKQHSLQQHLGFCSFFIFLFEVTFFILEDILFNFILFNKYSLLFRQYLLKHFITLPQYCHKNRIYNCLLDIAPVQLFLVFSRRASIKGATF